MSLCTGKLDGPCCGSRCKRTGWAAWDEWHYDVSTRDNTQGKRIQGSLPPQYAMSDLEHAVFRYVFADTFNGELSFSELLGIGSAVGSAGINMFSIAVVFANRFILSSEDTFQYPFLVDATIVFEFAYFFASLVMMFVSMRQVGVRVTVGGARLRNRFARYRLFARKCLRLGELNSFTLLRLLKPYAIRQKFNQGKQVAQHARGVCVPIILVFWILGTGMLMAFSVLAILAKVSRMEFIFRRDPLVWGGTGGWTLENWLAALGFLNNLIRRDLSEGARIKVLEYAIVGHYVALDGKQAALVDQLVNDFYEHAMGEVLDTQELTWRLRLELFAFFANLSASELFRFHEMAYGLGTATVDARSQLTVLLQRAAAEPPTGASSSSSSGALEVADSDVTATDERGHRFGRCLAWEHVSEENRVGERLQPPPGVDPADVLMARRVAAMLDPELTPPLEGVNAPVSDVMFQTFVQRVESYLSCTRCRAPARQEARERALAKRRVSRSRPSMEMSGMPTASPGGTGRTPRARRRSMFGDLLIPPLLPEAKRHYRPVRRPLGGAAQDSLRPQVSVPAGRVAVRIVACEDLEGQPMGAACCRGIDCDAFVEVSIPNLDADEPATGDWGNNVGVTHVAPSGDLNPVFGEVFVFPFDGRSCTVVLEVSDYDVGSLPDSLGFANLPVSSRLIRGGGWSSHKLMLRSVPAADAEEPPGDAEGRRVSSEPFAEESCGTESGFILVELGLPEQEQPPGAELAPALLEPLPTEMSAVFQPRNGVGAPPPTPETWRKDDTWSVLTGTVHEMHTSSSSSDGREGEPLRCLDGSAVDQMDEHSMFGGFRFGDQSPGTAARAASPLSDTTRDTIPVSIASDPTSATSPTSSCGS